MFNKKFNKTVIRLRGDEYMFRKLFCNHDYQLVDQVAHYVFESDKLPYKHTKIYMCSKCGKVRKIKY